METNFHLKPQRGPCGCGVSGHDPTTAEQTNLIDLGPLTLDQRDAAKLTNLSAKTLGRLADAGEAVGRIKIGRRVLYHRPTLALWLAAQAATVVPSTRRDASEGAGRPQKFSKTTAAYRPAE
jgi:hypothetical protein